MSSELESATIAGTDELRSPAPPLLPEHGKIQCARCFPNEKATWGQSVLTKGSWQLENNPLAWGGRNPVVMILGFSKGDRQCAVIRAGADLDKLPFAGMRANLTAILRRLGLLDRDRLVDDLIASRDPDIHLGSLVRCSIAKLDPATQKPMKAGDVIAATAADATGREIVAACAERFLRDLPPRLRVVVLLSNDDAWTQYCFEVVKQLHPQAVRLNEVAYKTGNVTWVHVVHPSGSSGRHIPAWLKAAEGKQGRKGRQALEAVLSSGAKTLFRNDN